MRGRRVAWAAFILIAVLLGCSAREQANSTGDCSPSFVKLADEPLEVQSGEYSIHASAVLIGCRADLNTLTEADHESLRGALADLMRENKILLITMAGNEQLRKEIIDRLNDAIGGHRVREIYFDSLGFSELLPVPQKDAGADERPE